MRRLLIPVLAPALVTAFVPPAPAETVQPMLVTATIVKGCVVAATGAGELGRIDFGTVAGTAQGTIDAALLSGAIAGIQIECTPGTSVSVSADQGGHAAGGIRRLALDGGSAAIPYQLFADGSATPWTTQQIALSFVTGATRRALPVTGRATLARPMAAGSYSDTVRVTIAW